MACKERKMKENRNKNKNKNKIYFSYSNTFFKYGVIIIFRNNNVKLRVRVLILNEQKMGQEQSEILHILQRLKYYLLYVFNVVLYIVPSIFRI